MCIHKPRLLSCYKYDVSLCFLKSRIIAVSANVFCWFYPTINKVYFILSYLIFVSSSQLRHNEPDFVSNHHPHDCLLNRLFRRRSKKTSKLRVTGRSTGNSPVTGPVTRKLFPFDDVIKCYLYVDQSHHHVAGSVEHSKRGLLWCAVYVEPVRTVILSQWMWQSDRYIMMLITTASVWCG